MQGAGKKQSEALEEGGWTVMYLQGMKQMAEGGGGGRAVKDHARLPCGRLGEGSCNEPFRDRRGEIGSLIAYLWIDSSVEILNETVNIC